MSVMPKQKGRDPNSYLLWIMDIKGWSYEH